MSAYKKIENQWARAISEGKKVSTKVNVMYDGTSMRPAKFIIKYIIDGVAYTERILNY